jgi:fibronectin-binding autotransporter adhesin
MCSSPAEAGDTLTLVGSADTPGVATIRVGDGTAAGTAMTATIDVPLIGDALLRKTDAGTLILGGVNTYTGGTRIEGGVVQIATDMALGIPTSALTLDGGTLRMTASLTKTRQISLGANGGTFDTVGGTATSILTAVDGNGALGKAGEGTLTLLADNLYTGGTTIGAGTLQLGNGGTTGSILGDIVDNARLVVNRSNELVISGTISGTGSFTQAGTGTTIVTAENSFTGGTTISAGTLQIGNGGTSGRILGDIVDNATLIVNRSDTKVLPGSISGTGQLIQAGTGTLVLVNENTYTGGTTISAGTLQIGDGGTTGSILGNVANEGLLAFNRADELTFAGIVSGTGAIVQRGAGTTILTGANTSTGGAIVEQGTLQVGDGGTSGQIFGDIRNDGTVILNRADDILYGSAISGTGNTIKEGAGTLFVTGANTYTGGTMINAGRIEVGTGGTTGSFVGDVVNNAELAVNRSDSFLITGVISGTGSFEQVGPGSTIFEANNSYTGGTLISQGTLQVGNGGETGLVPGNVVNNGTLVINRSNTKFLEGIVSGTGELVQAGLGTLIITNINSYSGGTAIESGILQISRDDNLGAPSGGLRIGGGTLFTTADMATARATVLAQEGGTFDVLAGTTLTHGGVIDGAGSLTKTGGGRLRLTGDNLYDGPTDILAGTLLVSGDQSGATGLTTVAPGGTLGGIGTIGGDVFVADGGVFAPGESPGTLTINGNLAFSPGSILNYEFGAADVVGGPLNDLAVVGGDLTLDGTLNVEVSAGGTFGTGVYRVFDYAGALTDSGLDIGLIPATGYFVQTSVSNQVNLVVTNGLTFRFWDGDAGPKNDGVVNGGSGLWQSGAGNDNWTDADGTPNAAFTDSSFAVFAGVGGTVTVDGSLGAINVTGMQFAADGYVVGGDAINLMAPDDTIVRVGDGTLAGRGITTTISSVLTGASGLAKTDLGTLILTGANDYAGATTVAAGALYVEGDQSAATGLTSVSPNATLGGGGTIGGSVAITDGGALSPGSPGAAPGTLTVAGDLSLAPTARLAYSFGQANVIGGPLNDLTVVGGDLVLDGTIDVLLAPGGSLDPGIYRVIDYAGALTNNGLTLGTIPSPGFVVQTSVANQVNLINTAGLTLNYWDGDGGARNDGLVAGGDGTWQNFLGNDNWTSAAGTPNAPFADAAFAIFQGAPGAVTIDDTLGAINVTGMQFAVDGYVVGGDAINLVGATSVIRVGDGTAAGTGLTTTIDAALNGTATLAKSDLGTLILTGANGYTGGTALNGGVLQIASDANLGAAAGGLNFAGGTLRTTADVASARATTLNAGGGTFETANGSTLTLGSAITGAGALTKAGDGTLLLIADSSYAGGTTITAGTLQLGNGGASGSVTGDIANDGALVIDRAGTLILAGLISGTGTIEQAGPGTTVLTVANSYTGATGVSAGTLIVNGDQSAATGVTGVAGGATLGGNGIIGGDVAVADDGILAPGQAGVGTLTVNGDLSLGAASVLQYDFGQAGVVGGPLNDLTVVGGDLTLDGTINVALAPGGSIDPGIYRVISYAGALTDNGLAIGMIPSPDFVVQTSIANQVNLINTAGLTLNFWDGGAGPKNDGVINGGNGIWQGAAGNDNWTSFAGTPNAPFTDASFAIFQGSAGTVTVDPSLGPVNIDGAQFVVSGYAVQGGTINLVGAGSSVVRVGDGTAAGAGFTTTIGSVLAGPSGLTKSDLGTLVLTGTNSYAGGTAITGGVLQIAADASLGAASGGLALDGGTLRTTASLASARATTLGPGGGTFETAPGTSFTLNGAVGGASALTKTGTGTLILGGTNSYAGGTAVNAGTVQISSDANLGAAAGPLTLDTGTLRTTADITTARAVTLVAGGGTFDTAADSTLTIQAAVTGAGSLGKTGAGTLILNAANTYAGPTDVVAGTLAVGDAANPDASILGPVTVAGGATLGGYGTIDGDVANGGTIAMADAVERFAGSGPGTFTVTGTLTNAGLASLAGSGVGNRLIVANYVGQNGAIRLNTVLGGDGSPTDQLVIDGGTATGSTALSIFDVGGGGAATPGNGIEVVVAANGATTAAGAFALAGRVVAGPYQYNLFQGGRDGSAANSWFLRSEFDGPIPPEPPGSPPPEPPPLYRPEVPTYTAMPSMALMFGRSLVDTLHERVGEEAGLVAQAQGGRRFSGAWGRVMGQRTTWDAAPGGVYNEGPAFRANTYALQIGFDLWRGGTPERGLNFAGAYGSFGWNEGIVRDFDLSTAGRVKFDAYSIGLYATHYGPGGWYVDAVVQGTRYQARAGSSFFEDLRTEGTGLVASLEAGVPLRLGGGFSIEPQAQILYQGIDFDDSADPAAEIRFDDVESLTGRLGLRLAHNGQRPSSYGPRPVTTWVRANVWHEFKADPRTSFSSADGFVPFRSNLEGTWAEFGAGVSTELTPGATLFASGSYQTAFGQEVEAWGARGGLRFNW